MTQDETDYAAKIRKIKDQYGGDKEAAHIKMDEVLCEALREHGEEELVEEYEGLSVW